MAEKMGDNKQMGHNKRILPGSKGEITQEKKLTQNFTTIITGHGNIKSHLHRFKIIDTRNCQCGNGIQTSEHILLHYAILQVDRERLIGEVAK